MPWGTLQQSLHTPIFRVRQLDLLPHTAGNKGLKRVAIAAPCTFGTIFA
jgi:hypothetical protein